MTYVKLVPNTSARSTETRTRGYNPPVDIVETKDDYRLDFDLPGFGKEDVKITVSEGILTLSGERERENDYDEKYFRHFERRQGAFSRSFRLPEFVDSNSIEAEYKNGVISLTLPKKEEAKPFNIKIK